MAKPSVIHLTVCLNSEEYVLGTLSFNTKKQEFSYHFSHPINSPRDHYNCDLGEETPRLDHITWHQNIAHIKRVDKVAIERIELKHGPIFCDNPIATPFFVESIYINGTEPCLPKIGEFKIWNGSQTHKILQLEKSRGFSTIFILIPKNMKTFDLLLGMQFLKIPEGMKFPPCLVDLCNDNHRAGRIILWNEWDCIILNSKYTCQIKSAIPDRLGSSYRLPNYINVPAAMTDLLMQANSYQLIISQ